MLALPVIIGASTFDVLHYRLDLTFPLTSNAFTGSVTLTCLALADNLDQVALDMDGGLTVSSVEMGTDRLVPGFSPAMKLLTLPFIHAVTQGDTFDIVIEYAADEVNEGFYNSTMSGRTDWAAGWFPCHDFPWDKATYELHIEVPVGVEVASVGLLKKRTISGDGQWETFHWQTEYPAATHLVGIMLSPHYERWSEWYLPADGDSIEVSYYVLERDTTAARADFVHVLDAMEFFAQRFGPYPFEKYGMAEVEPLYFGGLEFQTMSMISSNWITGNLSAEDGIVHELAHQWWGDAVSFDDWPSIWLAEGFAEYAAALFAEHFYGDSTFRELMYDKRDTYLQQAQTTDAAIFDPPLHDYAHIAIVYQKGAWVLHMLRQVVGDATMWALMRTFQDMYRYGNATIPQFQVVADSISGQDLAWFFNQWLYQPGYPQLRYSVDTRPATTGGYATTLYLGQAQTNGPVYKLPLEVRFQGAAAVLDTLLWLENRDQTFVCTTAFAIDSLVLDPGERLLMQAQLAPLEVARKPEPPQYYHLLDAYPNPFNPATTIRYQLPEEDRVSLVVMDLLGREVARLVDNRQPAGIHAVVWNGLTREGRETPSGIYLVRLITPGYHRTIRVMLLR